MIRGDSYSYPPRGLSREAAARYIGVGTTTFDTLVGDGRMPKPIRIGKRVVWDRIKIDLAFTDLGEEERENYIDAGLRRAKERPR
jgi:predicted DNA-binding transcriptional regulator AlpA